MAKEIIIDVDVNTKDAVKGVDNLDKSMEGLNETTGKTAEQASKLGTGLQTAGKDGVKGLAKVAKGFKGVGLAIKAAGIGLVIALFLTLKEALEKNQKALDFVNTATTAVGIVFNDLFKFISENFTPAIDGIGRAIDTVKNAFSDIPATLVKVKDAIVKNIEVRFNALIDTFGLLGSAIKKLFSGDFAGALEDAGDAGKKYVDVLTGVENTVDRVVDGVTDLIDATIAYTTEVITNSKAIVNNTKQLQLLEAQQTRIREQSDRDAERQRQIRDDFTKSFEERIAANEELGRILEAQEIAEKKTITDRIGALQSEQNQLGANFERRLEIFNLNTELIAVEAQQEGFRSEQILNKIALEKEQQDLKDEEQLARDEKEKERLDKIANDEIERIKKEAEARAAGFQHTKDGINSVATLNSDVFAISENLGAQDEKSKEARAKKNFEVNKALNLSLAGIDAFKAITVSLAQAPVAIGPIPNPAGIASLAFAAITSAANIAKIASAKYKGGASSASVSTPSVGGNASASTGGLNTETLFSTQSLEGGIVDEVGEGAGSNQQPIRATVLESDITDTQNRLNNFQESSEIG